MPWHRHFISRHLVPHLPAPQWIASLLPDVLIDLSMDLDARGPFFVPRAAQCLDFQASLLLYHDALCQAGGAEGAEAPARLSGTSEEDLTTDAAEGIADAENPSRQLPGRSPPCRPHLPTSNAEEDVVALSVLNPVPPGGSHEFKRHQRPSHQATNPPLPLESVALSALNPGPPGGSHGGAWGSDGPPAVFRPYVLMFEHLFVGANVIAMVACEGLERVTRPEGLASWRRRVRRAAAFVPSGCLPAVAERARVVVRRYGSCGVGLVRHRDAVQLTWMGQPLLHASVWRVERELLE